MTDTLQDALNSRLPELEDFNILYHKEESIDLPYLIRLITCAATNHAGPNCAFIVPQPEMIACFTAMFTALLDTRQHFSEWQENFARHGLRAGQKVQILPRGEVYEYAGIKEFVVQNGSEQITSTRFVLKLLSIRGNDGTVSVPISELLRLVPTERTRPYGTAKTPAEKMAPSDLDRVLGIKSYGNPSVFRNRVILQGTRPQMEEFFVNWDILSSSRHSALEDMTDFPWGAIDGEGNLIVADKYQLYGEPIIALANHTSPIDAYCLKQPEKSRTVILCGSSALKHSYDLGSIAERQRVILITDHLDEQETQEIENHNFVLWKPRKEEIFSGLAAYSVPSAANRIAPLKKLFIASGAGAETVSTRQVDGLLFQRLYRNIAILRRGITDRETCDAIVTRFQRALWRASELVQLPGKEYQDWLLAQVIEIESALEDHAAFIGKELAGLASETAIALTSELLPDIRNHSSQKFEAIREFVEKAESGKILVVTRHREAAIALMSRLQAASLNATVITYDDIRSLNRDDDREFETAIVTGWPGKHLFLEVLRSGVAGKIHAALYEHEKKCIDLFFRELKRTDGKFNPTPEKKAEITGIAASAFSFPDASDSAPEIKESVTGESDGATLEIKDSSKDIFDISWSVRPAQNLVAASSAAHAVKARFVSLSNDMCLYLSEDYHVSVISAANHEYRRKTVEELAVGDIIVFRGGSEQEILREVAISIYGDSYDRLRTIAASWKSWLKSLGSDPGEIWKKLVDAGLNRHPVTIFQWLTYDDRIGPLNLNDIMVIARATGDKEKVREVPRVTDAIRRVRGVHVEAGFRLTEIVMRQLAARHTAGDAENTGELERKLADVKLYTVEDIDDEYQSISPQFANIPRPIWSFDLDHLISGIISGKEMAHG